MNELKLTNRFENLQMVMKITTSVLNLCTDNQSKIYFIDGHINEIRQCVNCIDHLKEEVKQGIITFEMASTDMDYWTNENNWEDAKSLYDALTCPEISSECQRLRDAMEQLQKSLGELNHSLLDAPVECYQQFYDLCHENDGTKMARSIYKKFKCKCMYKDDLLRSMLYYQQKIIYIFYEKDILRYDDCPLQDPHSRKFKFDFELLCNEAEETFATIKFCRCMNHYLIMPDKYTIHLNTAKLGKYLFEYYPKFTYDDFFAIAFLEEALNLYNQKMKEYGFLDAEQNDDKEMNILKQPAAMVLWGKLQKAGIIDKNLMPTGKVTYTQLAIIVELVCASLQIKTTWKPFEELWGIKNLRTYYNKITYTDSFEDFRKDMKELFAS